MKKSTLVLLTLVPVAVGLVVNFTLRLPVIGSLLFFCCLWPQRCSGFISEGGMPASDGMCCARFL